MTPVTPHTPGCPNSVQGAPFATKKTPRDLHHGEQLSQNAAPPEGQGAGEAAARRGSPFGNFRRDPCDRFHARGFPEKHALSYFHGPQPPARLCSKFSCANFDFQTILQLGSKPVPAAAREQSCKATEKPASKALLPPRPTGRCSSATPLPRGFFGRNPKAKISAPSLC